MILNQQTLLSMLCILAMQCVDIYSGEGLLGPYPGYYACIPRYTDAPPQKSRAGQGPCLLQRDQDLLYEVTYVVRAVRLADDLISLTIDKALENSLDEDERPLTTTPSPMIMQQAPTKPSTLKGLLQQFTAILAARSKPACPE